MAGLLVAMPLYGCAAGQVMVASYEDENANCALLEKELGVAQARMKKLETILGEDHSNDKFAFLEEPDKAKVHSQALSIKEKK